MAKRDGGLESQRVALLNTLQSLDDYENISVSVENSLQKLKIQHLNDLIRKKRKNIEEERGFEERVEEEIQTRKEDNIATLLRLRKKNAVDLRSFESDIDYEIQKAREDDIAMLTSLKKQNAVALQAFEANLETKLQIRREQNTSALIKMQQDNILKRANLEEEAAFDLQKLQLSNESALLDARIKYINKVATESERLKQNFSLTAIGRGFTEEEVNTANEKYAKMQGDKATEIENLNKDQMGEVAYQLEIERINKKYELMAQAEGGLVALRQKMDEKDRKEKLKKSKKDMQEVLKSSGGAIGSIFGPFTKAGKEARDEARQRMKDDGMSDEEIAKAERSAKAQAALDLAGDFAKQLSSTISKIASTQSEIDTRLQGSKNNKKMGSYWRSISDTISSGIGANPLVKQADVVEKLKTLVGKGISYNVEQRAFLDTIKDKIATTFDATNATLVKLVRIQQADTTAARLGMESALTAFLNNMYETTEYMTEAADTIRQNLYEASALMGAKEATEFEYQVQKWMGSLYSVGFSNTEGLSGALGKLVAGDIEAVTNGGYGNLLVMAAQRANLSTAEILEKGLNDAETNKLMQAMVDYLADIYSETKNSRVVSQQFANVYGLTASDLKAAANLSKSTKAISKQNLNFGGMMAQLNNMANSMKSRTSMGEMLENAFDNFKYTMAEGIGNNPVLYGIYNIASMLDSVAGGIQLPAFSVMGNMVDLDTSVADLMRVGALSGSLLSGIGSLVSGLGRSGNGMLKKFGVSGSLSTVSRGNGGGLLTTATGSTISDSGYVGNSDGGDVQNKTMQDATEGGDQQLAEAQDESNEVKLSQVDEHVVQIYQLLKDVTSGALSLTVTSNDPYPWGTSTY